MDEIVCQTSHVQTDRCRSSCCGCSHTPVSNAIIRLTESIGTSEESPAFSRTRGAVGPRTHSQCNFELSARRIYIRVAGQPQFGTRGKTQVDGPSHTECALGTSLPPRGLGDLRQLPGVGRTTSSRWTHLAACSAAAKSRVWPRLQPDRSPEPHRVQWNPLFESGLVTGDFSTIEHLFQFRRRHVADGEVGDG